MSRPRAPGRWEPRLDGRLERADPWEDRAWLRQQRRDGVRAVFQVYGDGLDQDCPSGCRSF
eukprot:1124858-Alexandrium_andersonii.AAC.1